MRFGQRFSYLALPPEETRSINAAYHQSIHRDQSSLIPPEPEAFIHKALDLLSSDRYLEKGMGLMALTGRRPAETRKNGPRTFVAKRLSKSSIV